MISSSAVRPRIRMGTEHPLCHCGQEPFSGERIICRRFNLSKQFAPASLNSFDAQYRIVGGFILGGAAIMHDAKPLSGQIALVTGAGRGIGAAIAVQLAQMGAAVVLCARTEKTLQ